MFYSFKIENCLFIILKSTLKTIFYISLFLFGITSGAQSTETSNKKIEQAFPIESSEDFDQLRSGIEELVSIKRDGILWSSQLLRTLQDSQQWAEDNGSSQQKLLAQYYILMYYNNHLEDEKVIRLSKSLLTNPTFMEMQESVYTLMALGSSYRRKGYYQEQLNILNTTIEQNKKFNNIAAPSTYGYFNELALVYYNLEQYELSRHNFKKQANVFEKDNDFFRTSSMLNNIGLTFAKQHVLDSALIYYNRALAILETKQINDAYTTKEYIEHFKNVIKSNIVKIDVSEGDFSNSLTTLKNELASSKKVRELSTAAQAYQSIAELYYENEKLNSAKAYVDSTLIFERAFHNPSNRRQAILLKAKIALKQNNNLMALQYFNLANTLKDSLDREKDKKNFSEATAKYNFVKTEEELEKNRKLLQQEEKANAIQSFFLGLVVVLGVIIGWMLFKSRKANKLIAKQKEELHKGLKEKEIMLDEIHHRIKNNLQVISGILELQRGKIDSEKHARIYEESQGYLHSMSMIHEHLYEQGGVSKLDMQMYLNRLCDLLINSYPDIYVKYEAYAPTVRLSVKKATPLALIICELITNSLKHAFTKTGKIQINLSNHEENYSLTYSDNGSGYENINNPEFYNTGLNLILMLAEDLNGQVDFFNQDGFNCHLKFED